MGVSVQLIRPFFAVKEERDFCVIGSLKRGSGVKMAAGLAEGDCGSGMEVEDDIILSSPGSSHKPIAEAMIMKGRGLVWR